jgi:hypothetical protein
MSRRALLGELRRFRTINSTEFLQRGRCRLVILPRRLLARDELLVLLDHQQLRQIACLFGLVCGTDERCDKFGVQRLHPGFVRDGDTLGDEKRILLLQRYQLRWRSSVSCGEMSNEQDNEETSAVHGEGWLTR